MASTDMPDPEVTRSSTPVPPPPKPLPIPYFTNTFVLDAALRALLFAATLVAVVVMVTSKQTKITRVQGYKVSADAKFDQSPAFVYFAVAMSIACLYSMITGLASFGVLSFKPAYETKFLLHAAFWDVIMLGLVASATGATAGVAYIGLKGNDSVVVSLFASVLLILLIMLSVLSIHHRRRE
ncbi:hypothetical protein K2173_017613 [Erythroxylum novogranatense]|uniref:CASP-like protein n=1 Tax=Erythroxylum novogranatense TaxID=1862640 RepID=A0AAV8TN34_9ROSI|nr:hypothetical protein K2173_017613 [Erythroxylum novogranatense]